MNNKKGQEVYGNYINILSEKNFIWGKWVILGPKMAHPHKSGLQGFLKKFCTMKRVRRYMEH